MLREGIMEAFFREGGQGRSFWGRDIALGTEGRVEINRRVEGSKAVSRPLKKLEWQGGPRPESLFGGGGVGALEPFEVLKG